MQVTFDVYRKDPETRFDAVSLELRLRTSPKMPR